MGGWVLASVLFTAGFALGAALGYRRGWEAHRADTPDDTDLHSRPTTSSLRGQPSDAASPSGPPPAGPHSLP